MQSRPSHYNTRYKHDLTPQQERVLGLIAAGRTNAEIADSLGLSLDGVKWHVREILAKLNLDSREEAAAWWGECRRPSARAGRLLHGMVHVAAWKVGLASAGVLAAGCIAMAAGLAVRGGGSDDTGSLRACPPSDLTWRAQTQRVGDVTVYRLSISLRDERWYDRVLGVVGLGHAVDGACRLTAEAGFELLDAGEPVDGPSGKPGPPRRLPVVGVVGNPSTLPVSVTVEKGKDVRIAEGELSNWCAGPAKLFIEASVPAVRKDGPPTVSTSLGTDVAVLPGCMDSAAPPRLEVHAP